MFNPHSRWDRNLPAEKTDYLYENIEVMALFRHGKVIPQYFQWRSREYKINKINYTWQGEKGQEPIHYFSVNVGDDLYQISFNNKTYIWRMDKIID